MDGAVLLSYLVVIQTVDGNFKQKWRKTATSAQTLKPDNQSAVCKKQHKSERNDAVSLMTEESSALWRRITVTAGTFHVFLSLNP